MPGLSHSPKSMLEPMWSRLLPVFFLAVSSRATISATRHGPHTRTLLIRYVIQSREFLLKPVVSSFWSIVLQAAGSLPRRLPHQRYRYRRRSPNRYLSPTRLARHSDPHHCGLTVELYHLLGCHRRVFALCDQVDGRVARHRPRLRRLHERG